MAPSPALSPTRSPRRGKAAATPSTSSPSPRREKQQPPPPSSLPSSSPSRGGASAPFRSQHDGVGGLAATVARWPLTGNVAAKLLVFILMVGNVLMVANVVQNMSGFMTIQAAPRGMELAVLDSSSSSPPAIERHEVHEPPPPPPQQQQQQQQREGLELRREEAAAAVTEAAKEEEKEEDDKAAAATAWATTPGVEACHFPFADVDPACPRFVMVDTRWWNWAGLGDRFLQYIVGLTYAIHTGAVLINQDASMGDKGVHGEYGWIPDFLRLNSLNANMTLEAVQEQYGNMTVIQAVEEYGKGVYKDRIAALREQCHVIIKVNNDDCINGRECYYAEEPRLYDVVHNVLSCWFLQTDRASLLPLIYDPAWYNVVIHLRVGDVTLLGKDKGGLEFFTKLKSQLDAVLSSTFPVHFYFFAEAPNTRSAQQDYGKEKKGGKGEGAVDKTNAVFGEAPQAFAFLRDIFQQPPDLPIHKPQRVSFVNDLGVPATVLHQMNADMVVTTGSSFPLVAVTASPKPVVLYGKPKEGGFFEATIRPDYALVGDDGVIFRPSLSELQARVVVRYAEVHDKTVPYELRVPEVSRRRRRRLRRS